jgi:hypothetical protein
MCNTAICGEPSVSSDTQSGKKAEVETIRREDLEKELDVAWLAGLIDGEGCLYVNVVHISHPNQRPYIAYLLNITNTNLLILKRATEALKYLGVSPLIINTKPKNRTKIVFTLQINGKGKLERLLPRLLPQLTGKKRQAELVLDLIAYTSTRPKRTPDGCQQNLGTSFYVWEDPIILAKIEQIKQARLEDVFFQIPSTTDTQCSSGEDDDTVCSA